MKPHARAIIVIGGLLLLNGLVIGAPMTISELTAGHEVTFEESVADWRYVAFNAVYLAVLIALVAAMPSLAGWTGRTGRRMPRWIVPAFTVAAALQACTVFTQAVVTPFLLDVAPQALVAEDGGIFAVTMTVVWVTWIVALCTLAVCGIVTKTMPVAASVVMIVGGIIIPVFGPIGSILVGAAFAWSGWAQLRVAAAPRVSAALA
ncbi:MAG: hypothetical protein M3Y46_02555 [Actinomycetota bacterium]|nr:hypothetical protein [Actinomycetota bacterium]